MAKDQSDYFNGKHPWSETKDDLLEHYLTPYFTKVYRPSRDGIVYVDAFAGPGKFDDGAIGSPIIAIEKYLAVSRKQSAKRPVQFIFGEANAESRKALGPNVEAAIGNVNYIRKPIITDSFDSAMDAAQLVRVTGGRVPSTFFYYIDPFGIKDLRMDLLLASPNFAHTEALVNFNTVGFLREACEVMRIEFDAPEGVVAYGERFDASDSESFRMQRLSAVIGSDGWKDIVTAKRGDEISFWEAEYQIGRLFCENARKAYRYVTNMPIKDMSRRAAFGGEVKYRLIHMTNNASGCVIMNNSMVKRNEERQIQQPTLFRLDVDGRDVEPDVIAQSMRDAVAAQPIGKQFTMGVLAAYVISRCGVFDRETKLLRAYLKPLIEQNLVKRVDALRKDGKPKDDFNEKVKVYRPQVQLG